MLGIIFFSLPLQSYAWHTDWTICNNFFSILFKNYANKWRTKNEEMALLCMLIFCSDNFCTHIYCCVRDGTKQTHITFSVFGHNYCHYDSRCLYVFCCDVVLCIFVNYMFLTFFVPFHIVFKRESVLVLCELWKATFDLSHN